MKTFNITGLCVASKHYMVDISGKVAAIKRLIDNGDYFTIKCARQYGKTTTINELCLRLTLSFETSGARRRTVRLGSRSTASASSTCWRRKRGGGKSA